MVFLLACGPKHVETGLASWYGPGFSGRPTASGVVFMTFEDETAMANLVVWPKLWERQRKLARTRSLLGADGVLQRQGDAVSVLVERFWEVPWPPTEAKDGRGDLKIRSRDFR